MPEVECPIAGCDFKTADLNDAVVIALINAHCVNHVPVVTCIGDNSGVNNDQPPAVTNSKSSQLKTKLPLQKLTFQDLRQDKDLCGHFIGLLLSIVASLLDIIFSFAQPIWYFREEGKGNHTSTTYVGLWKACIERKAGSNVALGCFNHKEDLFLGEYLIVGGAQVFQCFGIIFIFFAIFSTFLKIFLRREMYTLTNVGAIHAFWAGVAFLGSVAFVSDGLKKKPHRTYTDLGYSMASISGGLALLCSLTLVGTMCWMRTKNTEQEQREHIFEQNQVHDPTYQELIL